jgi:hypothetical protein
LRPQHRETALVEGMNDVAHRLVGATELARNCGGQLALGTGEQYLTAAHRKRGRGPETGL